MAIDTQLGLIILAGGQGRRVGGANKALLPLHGQPLLLHTLQNLNNCSNHIIISANRDLAKFEHYGYPVCPDLPAYTQMGPLAGIFSAAQALPDNIDYIQIVPCDLPLLHSGIIMRLYQHLSNYPELDIVCAADQNSIHPIVCQFRRRHLNAIRNQLDRNDKHSVRSIIRPYAHTIVTFTETKPFTNYNNSAMFSSAKQDK